MITLALDSSASVASVCVADGGEIKSLFSIGNIRSHSEILLPMVKDSLEKLKLTVKDVDMFACGAGPGSFTGLRIGISTVKGLAFGSGKPCVGVSTLEALSVALEGNLTKDKAVCCVMDARRGCFFNAIFMNGERLCPDRYISAEELGDELKKLSVPVLYAGDGYDLAHKTVGYELAEPTPLSMRYASASGVAVLAERIYRNNPDGNYTDASLAPFYLRPSQAEKNLEEKKEL